jgi:F-type H+-transporting ATPase subunit a
MLGGLIIMELLYKIVILPLGYPAILSIYFNLFDGIIQTFIFLVLTLTFIEEAVE